MCVEDHFRLEELFKVGPFNRFEFGKRFGLNCDSMQDKIERVVDVLCSGEFGESVETFFVIEQANSELETKFLDELRRVGVTETLHFQTHFDEDDELYRFVLRAIVPSSQIRKIVRGKLARHMPQQAHAYFMAELFFSSPDGRIVLNLYDDRGFDVVAASDRDLDQFVRYALE